jgi:uncharacterized membrane protein YfcA
MGPTRLNGVVSSLPSIVLAGAAVGVLYGLFGVGSAFATPLLAILGVPGLAAVASPLPALVPGSAGGGWAHARQGHLDSALARRTLLGAVPACIFGSVASRWVGGTWLLVLSGLILVVVGTRVVVTARRERRAAIVGADGTRTAPVDEGREQLTRARRERRALIVVIGAGVGFVAGLLANGGGFLLVPTFLLALGLDLSEATATSLVVVTVLSIPAVVTHGAMGDIDWAVALPFAAGLVPATALAAMLAERLDVGRLRNAFGVVLMLSGSWFLWRQLQAMGVI